MTTFIIGLSIFYFYSAEQSKIRGFDFGNEIQDIQNELKVEQNTFYSKISMFNEGMLSKNEFLLYSDCLLYTSPRPRDATLSRMPSSA